jgi:group II intron reverse transcriptase/maturase
MSKKKVINKDSGQYYDNNPVTEIDAIETVKAKDIKIPSTMLSENCEPAGGNNTSELEKDPKKDNPSDASIKKKIIYKDLISVESLKKGLVRTKTGVSPGLDGETKSQITDKRLEKLSVSLANQSYKPTPVKKVGIPKPDGGVRYLGITSQIDKVVQGAILECLEPILEPIFIDTSYGFRPNKGCHDALKRIKYHWKAVTWIISVDISKCFDKINHEILLRKLEDFCDQATVELIRKLLKAGYVDIHNFSGSSEQTDIGTPQGSLISPILCNLYLHELDIFVRDTLLPVYNRGEYRSNTPEYSKRKSLTEFDKEVLSVYPELKGAIARVKHNKFVLGGKFSATDGFDPNFRRLGYVRYADDFLLGFIGPRTEAESISEAIKGKLAELKLEVNAKKSKIYHGSDVGIKYLGAYIRFFSQNKVKVREDGHVCDEISKEVNKLHAQSVTTAHMRVPVDDILQRLVDRKLAKRRKDGTVRGTAVLQMSMLEDTKIVQRFSSIIRGLLNYYSFVNHRSDLWKIFAVLRKSCALTLGAKKKIGSAARVYALFGPELKVKDNLGTNVAKLEYPKSLKTKIDFKTGNRGVEHSEILKIESHATLGSTRTNIKTSTRCEYEGCEETKNLEAHHLNPMSSIEKRKDLTSYEKALIRRSRKVVMLCKKHHNEYHRKRLLSGKAKETKELVENDKQ